MRKNTKSVLAALLKKKSNTAETKHIPSVLDKYVIDGGKFLQAGPWLKKGTYNDLLDEYVTYAEALYNPHSHFVIDGYDDENCTKKRRTEQESQGQCCKGYRFHR